MDDNSDSIEIRASPAKIARIHFGIVTWTIFIIYIKAQQRRNRIWNVVSRKMKCREDFRVAISKQHPGYFDNLSDKTLMAKCNYLEHLIRETMECIIEAKKNGVEITDGNSLQYDLNLGRNGFNIPDKDQTGRSKEEIEAWKVEIKTHLVFLAKDEMRPPDLTGNCTDFTKSQYNESKSQAETTASAKKARGDGFALKSAMKTIDLGDLTNDSDDNEDQGEDECELNLPDADMHHTFAKMQNAVGVKLSSSKKRKYTNPTKRQGAANKHPPPGDPFSSFPEDVPADFRSNEINSVPSLDKCAMQLMNKLSKDESEHEKKNEGLQSTADKIATIEYLKSLKEAVELGVIEQEEFEELRKTALENLRKA